MSYLPPVSPLTRQFGVQGPMSPIQQQQSAAFQQELARRASPMLSPSFAQRGGQFLSTGMLPPSETVGKTEKFFFTLLCVQYFALTFLTLTLNNAFKEDDKTYCFMNWSKNDQNAYKFAIVWNTIFLVCAVFFSGYKMWKHRWIARVTMRTSPMMYAYGFLLLLALFAAISSAVMTNRVLKQTFEKRYATEEAPKKQSEDEEEVEEEFAPITELDCAVFKLDTDYKFFQVLVGFCWFITAVVTLILLFDPIYRQSLLSSFGAPMTTSMF